ncbi:MAG: hypothetical protein OEZ57_06920 [Nitrospirota bacterium]|nr:hypothetical protein [Nitrospirota bacterium]MDH5585276.1 hypothetical protein [Nitrospirota bacterium]MDH5774629.1 hypothetical protein [Nitrospirota bacterium]
MKKFMFAVVTGLFVMGIGSVSFAGMLDKAVEATGKADAMAKEAQDKTEGVEQKSIEAQDASTDKAGGMMDQAKDAAKETVNEQIDNLGK